MHYDLIVVGAGIAGLALARELRAQGYAPVVLERARGVGGRCATRRVEGQPVDHGLPYLHGRSQRFLAELAAVPAVSVLAGWPQVVVGDGLPCRPEAFSGTDRRLAFGEGASRFAKHLAEGLDVRLGAEVTALRSLPRSAAGSRRACELRLASGETMRANAVALTMPAPSAITLLRAMDPLPPAIAAQLPLLELVRMLPCLAVIARYPAGVPAPEWQASFPGAGRTLHSILHDSSKRAGAVRLTLVLQARPGFSDAHLNDSADSWTRAMLEEAAALHGAWVAQPELAQSHVWRKARVAAASELSGPLAVRLDDGALLGVAGDGLHDAGGAEGAFLSGIALADRFAEMLPIPK
jgi:predicted NAD/FAD-dependent oxidoreductase